MKQEVIEQMREKIRGYAYWCLTDFEKYDVPSLEEYDGSFLWLTRGSGTSLLKTSESCVRDWFGTESRRMSMFRDIMSMFVFDFYSKNADTAVYYYDGLTLEKVSMEAARWIYREKVEPVWKENVEEHLDECAMCHTRLGLRFNCADTMMAFDEDVAYAKSIGDLSFLNCVHRLQGIARAAVDHHILLKRDFVEHSYTFYEMVNRECCRMVGGIIYDEAAERRWSTHT